MQCWMLVVVVALRAIHHPRLDGIDGKEKGRRCGPDRHSMDMVRGNCAPSLKRLVATGGRCGHMPLLGMDIGSTISWGEGTWTRIQT